jgi:hypothetical protein
MGKIQEQTALELSQMQLYFYLEMQIKFIIKQKILVSEMDSKEENFRRHFR